MSDRQSRREFMGLTAAGLAGALTRPWLGGARAALSRLMSPSRRPRSRRVQREGLHDGPGDAARRGVRGERRAVRGRRAAPRTSAALAGKRTQMFDAKQMTIVPGFTDCHNHAGGTTLLYEVLVGNPFEVEFVTIASIIEKLRAKAQQTPPGTWVEGYFHDDTKLKDKRPLNRARSRQGVDRASGRRAASRRTHVVLQQQGARAGGHHEGHAEPAGRHVRPRRERRARTAA